MGGAPFSIGLQCAFLGEIVCSLDTFLGGTVPTILASDTNIAGTVPTRADSSGFPAGVSGNDPAPLSECVMLWDMCDVPQHGETLRKTAANGLRCEFTRAVVCPRTVLKVPGLRYISNRLCRIKFDNFQHIFFFWFFKCF